MSFLNPGRMGLLGAPTYPMLRDATMASLLETLEENNVPFDFNRSENILKFTDNGSRILFRPIEDFERLRGTNLAWFGLDELTYASESSWLRLEGRLRDPKANRLAGFGVWTPKGFDWVYRRFIARERQGYDVVLAKPFENRFLLSQIPDFYERLRTSYDERFFQQEALGEYLSLGGDRVYHTFERPEHIRELHVDRDLPLLWALDFNVDPMCSVVAQVRRGRISVLGEIVLRRASTEEACQKFAERYGQHSKGVVIYGDASGNAMQTTGWSDYDIIRRFFRGWRTPVSYRVPKSNPSVRERVQLVNARLKNAAGDVQMHVDPKCKELVMDFEQVSYVEGSTQIDKDRDRRRSHLSDALGYMVWQECQVQPVAGERPEPLL